jgi:hypothetical protein
MTDTSAPILMQRSVELKHHFNQACSWMMLSESGKKTAAMGYAAFEFRLCIERIAYQYWRELLGNSLTEKDLADLKSFKSMENRIYGLAGHQQAIDRHFDFGRELLRVLCVDQRISTPKFGVLSRHWHTCSELCHLSWTLVSADASVASDVFGELRAVEDCLGELLASPASWPQFSDPEFLALRDRYIKGAASSRDIDAYAKSKGVYAVYRPNDGSAPKFVGVPVPPDASGIE